MSNSKVLVVDDEEWIRNQLKWSISNDYEVLLADNVDSAKEIMTVEKPDLVMLDISLTPDIAIGTEGLSLLQYIIGLDSTIKVIMITGNDTRENALKCIAMGAFDFYSKPINTEEIKVSIKRALYIQSLERENQRLQSDLERRDEFAGIITECKQMEEILGVVRRVSTTDITVLVQGESGTGKELIARAIHYNSDRRNESFVTINCGAIPENLLESELFGYEKGAFTDAHKQKKGKLEMAQNGTVFLDEIAELPSALQVKILRFLQQREIERVGGSEAIELNLRVIAATNRNIHDEIKNGRFRDDLYYRLGVILINLPPLRDRGNDVIILANTFLKKFSKDLKSDVIGFTDEAIDFIKSYIWPGNVRELENRVKRGLIMSKGAYITLQDIDPVSSETAKFIRMDSLTYKEAKDRLEMNFIMEALKANGWNLSRTAEQAGITRTTLYSLMDRYDIPHTNP